MIDLRELCKKNGMPVGVHVVSPDYDELQMRINEGYHFIAYSIDAVFLNQNCQNPQNRKQNQ